MNDEERDRSGDGAGPSQSDDSGPYIRKSHFCFAYITLIFLSFFAGSVAMAQEGKGLSVTFDAGVLRPSNDQANFYRGIPTNLNTVERVLHSEAYGYPMWVELTDMDLITSAISNYNQLQVEEYGNMTYRIAVQLGLGFRYGLSHNWAWHLRFDYAQLEAVGQFLLASGRNNAGMLTNQDAYVACPISGAEKRINIDFSISKSFPLVGYYNLELALGASLNNAKVVANDIMVGNSVYNILDVWNGQSPSAYVQQYDYINQGGIGYGGFGTIGVNLELPSANAVSIYYSLYYTRIALPDYNAFAPQHLFGLRFELGNFSFIG